jgi:hypothetical protein
MWQYFVGCGIAEADLQGFRDNPCLPDIIGINHYPASERYLDEKMEAFCLYLCCKIISAWEPEKRLAEQVGASQVNQAISPNRAGGLYCRF